MTMKQCVRVLALAAMVASLSPGCARTDWSSHKNWPKKASFRGAEVLFHRAYRTGDYDTDDTAPGQQPATIQTYYSYVKNGKEIRHGKYTAWYAEGKPKAETVFVHGEIRDRTTYFFNGKVRERVRKSDDGEEAMFYDRSGALVGRQLYDRKSRKLTYLIGGKVVSGTDFWYEVNRRVYQLDRITP